MVRLNHIIFLMAVFYLMLSFTSCNKDRVSEEPQLMVSLYIPGATMTRAETGTVSPLDEERKITSLRIWVFLHDDDGTPVSFKSFDSGLDQTGIPSSTITRFGMPLTQKMFYTLTASPAPTVDVYAVANAESALNIVPGENTSRDFLDKLSLDNKIGGNSPLTQKVPDAGLPMSGVLKGAPVTGGYPVLNISTLKLVRAVSKIRFVFCQQGIPASGDTPADIANDECAIVGITFGGTTLGHDCQVSTSERLFTTETIDLGNDPKYQPLNSSIPTILGTPRIPNDKLSIVVDPEELFFRSSGNESETAEHYESRLDAAISKDSQIGPIYLRETDKTISGTITYRTSNDGPTQTASFAMQSGGFPRNHTWIVYACFVEETKKLQLKVVVLPWEWSSYAVDYTTGMVNVIRRFTVAETSPATFKKVQSSDSYYDIWFWHHVQIDESEQENLLQGDIIISSPVGGKLHCIPVPGNSSGSALSDAIIVSPSEATIYPNYLNMENGRIEDCRIPIQIKCNLDKGYTDQQLEGNYIDLHFSVETPDGRFVDLGSESIDYYRFILKQNWNQ